MNEQPAPIQGPQEMQISVEISDLKRMNDIAEIPVPVDLNSEIVPQKVDNDLESSDLGFSEGHEAVDEHAYQIGELGEFEVERSLSDEIEAINRDQASVDFSDGPGGLSMDLSEVSQEAQYNDSSFSSNTANQLSDESQSFYTSSMPGSSVDHERYADDVREEDYEWERFVKEEERKHGKPAEKPKSN